MKDRLRIYRPKGKIDYKHLRKINPEMARKAVLEYLKTTNHNISEAASIFGINRPVVYDIIKKEKEGDLRDRSKVPNPQEPHRLWHYWVLSPVRGSSLFTEGLLVLEPSIIGGLTPLLWFGMMPIEFPVGNLKHFLTMFVVIDILVYRSQLPLPLVHPSPADILSVPLSPLGP